MQEIFQAIAGGLNSKVIGLLKRDPDLFQATTEEGITPVLFSLYYGKLDLSKEIFRMSPNKNLFEAVALGDWDETKRVIEEFPETINSYSKDGWTALHLASYFGHFEITEFLIRSGADLALTSKSKLSYGNTALHSAIATGKKEIVSLLLERGADANSVQNPGQITPLHVAASRSGSIEIIQLLLRKGADKAKVNSEEQTPYSIAIGRGNDPEASALKID
ncbi:ankyrin repeat domain-containing protein [Leptospira gomenensis]|uniref:Ankyrin repeat domain-containing protein n=1 Tax=Leptospira gomenensis TaxID=2484974 RepID=A0A5F1YRY0_9LEPT|nr:ankyrin repeat domain-containing protein [Leptospira gomenensis]TGK33785.1 ankyrin repeat domain-containing protein [Leptospira gomenensis]TGK36354.1 ankyrin repeat domain-containing protein [Leptospira gomenensis]TGK47378.1 ankyrin repeat domain-containing protein [Leptospira gomenensis]TGK60673.1 ankyrin repeat domain-containing protein [Leptospira gomenensis]